METGNDRFLKRINNEFIEIKENNTMGNIEKLSKYTTLISKLGYRYEFSTKRRISINRNVPNNVVIVLNEIIKEQKKIKLELR